MTDGHSVVEGYSHPGPTRREYLMRFLRTDLAKRRIVTCAETMTARGGQLLMRLAWHWYASARVRLTA